MLSQNALRDMIQQVLPDAIVTIREFANGGDHFQVEVTSAAFIGKSRVMQHQMVYAALREHFSSGEVHALALVTKTPVENENVP
ncbi:MAG: BolA family transcriptional regulator [Deltaproteobacteria bacterium]|nr:BolA family transcriptional regulator [Deltaproteobacteria bacterium]